MPPGAHAAYARPADRGSMAQPSQKDADLPDGAAAGIERVRRVTSVQARLGRSGRNVEHGGHRRPTPYRWGPVSGRPQGRSTPWRNEPSRIGSTVEAERLSPRAHVADRDPEAGEEATADEEYEELGDETRRRARPAREGDEPDRGGDQRRRGHRPVATARAGKRRPRWI